MRKRLEGKTAVFFVAEVKERPPYALRQNVAGRTFIEDEDAGILILTPGRFNGIQKNRFTSTSRTNDKRMADIAHMER